MRRWKRRLCRAADNWARWVLKDTEAAYSAAHAVHLDPDGLSLRGGVERVGSGPDGRDPLGIDFLIGFESDHDCYAGAKFRRAGGYMRGGLRKSVVPSNAGRWATTQGLFGLEQLELARMEDSCVLLLEGESDYLAAVGAVGRARLWSVCPVAVAFGVGQDIAPFVRHFDGLRVIVCFDNDVHGAGMSGALAAARLLFPIVESVTVVWPPGLGMDFADYLDTGATIGSLMADARNQPPISTTTLRALECLR